MVNPTKKVDLLIAGAGLAGCATACAAAQIGLNVALVESRPEGIYGDNRAIALGFGSVLTLNQLGLWSHLSENASQVKHIHVSRQGGMGTVHLNSDLLHLPALGVVIPHKCLQLGMESALRQYGNLRIIRPASVRGLEQKSDSVIAEIEIHDHATEIIHATLVIGADGVNSKIRRMLDIASTIHDYQQNALVSDVDLACPPASGSAYERFLDHGSVAALPLNPKKMSIVWNMPAMEAQAWLESDSSGTVWSKAIERVLPQIAPVRSATPPLGFPLKSLTAQRRISGRALIIGNAACQVHPVGAQGFNLVLDDVNLLFRLWKQAIEHNLDIGDTFLLRSFSIASRDHQQRILRLTDRLAQRLKGDGLLWPWLHGAGMFALDHISGFKTSFLRQTTHITTPSLSGQEGPWSSHRTGEGFSHV